MTTTQTTTLLRRKRGWQLRHGRPPTPMQQKRNRDPNWQPLLTSLPDYNNNDMPPFGIDELWGPSALTSVEIKDRVWAWQRGERPTP